ncbi:MAG: response regulator, partial [Ignavibacteria bacterium]
MKKTYTVQIVITDFNILNRSNTRNKKEALNLKSPINSENIILSHDDDYIQISFAAMESFAGEKIRYAYKLENFNDDWIYAGSNQTVTYTNLSPGDYIFRVKGVDNDLWNTIPAAIAFTIRPPWWSTWWAYTLYSLIFLGILYLVRRYELNRIYYKNQLKLEKVRFDTLRNIDQLKSKFFTNISHEFRTPLTLILGQIDSLQSSIKDKKQGERLKVAHRNAKRVLRLINQVLDLSKLESGSEKLNARTHNIVAFLKSVFSSLKDLAEKKKIVFNFSCESDRIYVDFEPDKMEKIFYNLFTNAIKFTPLNGKVSINVSICYENEITGTSQLKMTGVKEAIQRQSASRFVKISVKDSGIGIPVNRLSDVFTRYYQVNDSHICEDEGTGIGLALAKELVELHNGRISVDSSEGNGSVFIVTLPLSNFQSHKDSIEHINMTLVKSGNEILDKVENSLEQVRGGNDNSIGEVEEEDIILLVEDNKDVRDYITEQLNKDFIVLKAKNGNEGIAVAKEKIPDLIITDLMMPEIDGLQLTNELKRDEKTSHIPIVMVTAKASVNNKIEGLETGADDYMVKPFDAKELLARSKNLINSRKQLRERFGKATVIKPSEVTVVSVDQEFLKNVLKIIEENMEDE